MDADLSLKDERRLTTSATVDPSERLAAVTDNLGRVLVVDVWTRMVLRLWKGHRNAQLAWIEVRETVHSGREARCVAHVVMGCGMWLGAGAVGGSE